MPKYTKIPSDTFKHIAINAGIIATAFDTTTGEVAESAIVGATSGGTNITYTPTFTDYGEDVDNCPTNTKELKRQDSDETKVSTSFITLTKENAGMMLNAEATESSGVTKVVPKKDIDLNQFKEIWIIGDYSEYNGEKNGGYVAVKLMNVLSTGGFNWQTTNKGKGTFAYEGTAHYSIADQNTVPFELYFKEGTAESEATTVTSQSLEDIDNAVADEE